MGHESLTFYQVDAFADKVFAGNPAAVVPMVTWLPDSIMQAIAMENNLSETAFFVPREGGFHLRWFTPVNEVDLCGHATLASAHVVVRHLGWKKPEIRFTSAGGELIVAVRGDLLGMNFPSRPGKVVQAPGALVDGLGMRPLETRKSRDFMAVLETEAQVLACRPDAAKLSELDVTGIMITAPGAAPEVDFVSRFFAPREGIPEDPVTGSAHCTLIPYWAERLGKDRLTARQVSRRGGTLYCELRDDRVAIAGRAVTYAHGTILIHAEAEPV
ncbi:MAG TPA: PhzF family phenazine biosynthesis protein [Candidatus Aminicenantes bacterium]|nr:PhzF family phenazine biosynthesis protein [Candidatus Aminicenantes bacterium]